MPGAVTRSGAIFVCCSVRKAITRTRHTIAPKPRLQFKEKEAQQCFGFEVDNYGMCLHTIGCRETFMTHNDDA